MKVLIVSIHVPFISGGAEILENNLKNALIEYGHEELVDSLANELEVLANFKPENRS